MIELPHLTHADLPRLRQFWKDRWSDEFVVAHGVVYPPDGLDGFVIMDGNEWIGLITCLCSGDHQRQLERVGLLSKTRL